MARFGRVITAMITPFDRDGSLDLDGAAKLAQWLVDNGNEGLVVAGTTGESPTLTHAEQIELVRIIADAVDVPVIAGAGSNDTRAAIDLTERATQAGAAAILSVTPYYNRPSQEGLLRHYAEVAKATHLPIMLYDIPARTGRRIETATVLELANAHPTICALKDAAGNMADTAALIAQAPPGFEVYSGEDTLNLALLAVGAVGVVSVASHWCGLECRDMVDAFQRGDVVAARQINQRLIPSWAFESGDRNPNPIPTKAMMKVLGLPGGDCRSPMGPEPDDLQDRARAVLAGLGR
ncbi:MAG: 4-hydroxy-tetrahydrodipicolinate synthase [Actinobacteria bacterium]|uniref:4-hydroxy-tetrahydrodipicolinate synthase n=1 Tax=freshwater metagenome TaxID=449393 RepID=A0A6J7R320_9ZZZZ|nr:4-hydroxy-tetrahydrodipicolinate synthase [Actinomycetota bacterium]MSW90224.1 4-hydroxy-tetrahydrodipicolinate synthase [Actinomycetota bacterium]MSX88218.1 4-hydroxy-tetrahydrodipicolinate synthase [Actinomycetota bacterium]MSY72371.1 4-hydroxy-tetrahydrodipicolinate synthase [Actinomycetota bacterium]